MIAGLRARYDNLISLFEGRSLKSNREGCTGNLHWIDPDVNCATEGKDYELRMAVDDFKAILSEIRRLK